MSFWSMGRRPLPATDGTLHRLNVTAHTNTAPDVEVVDGTFADPKVA